MRLIAVTRFAVVLLLGTPLAYSQDQKAAGGAGGGDEIRSIHQLLEQQAHQLETLTQQVAKLSALIETAHGVPTSPAPSPATQNMPPVQETNPAPAASPEIPKAEAVDIGTTHVVSRGETLTSIAKQYKVSVGELQKVNKIHNDRTLQIGQTLTIPSPKSGDSHKKENQ
jgi:LysM repeat protein